jgi:hypothetical protein
VIKYKKFQFAWIIVVLYIIVIVWMTFAYINQWGNNPIDVYGYIFIMTLFSVILLVFYGMTIIVTDKHLKIKFGIGLYTKKIDLASINTLTIVKTPICYVYGSIIPNGLIYNLGRKQGIEIQLKKKKQVIQIGTNDLEKLKEAVEKSLSAAFFDLRL